MDGTVSYSNLHTILDTPCLLPSSIDATNNGKLLDYISKILKTVWLTVYLMPLKLCPLLAPDWSLQLNTTLSHLRSLFSCLCVTPFHKPGQRIAKCCKWKKKQITIDASVSECKFSNLQLHALYPHKLLSEWSPGLGFTNTLTIGRGQIRNTRKQIRNVRISAI